MTGRVVVGVPVAAAAEVLDVSRAEVRRMLRDGELVDVYAGRNRHVEVESLRRAAAASPLAVWTLDQALERAGG